jgi:hypothetical protein
LSRVLIGLLVVAGPLVAVQSVPQHHLSFGESGRLNYRWYVGGLDHAPPVHEAVAETRLHSAPSTVALDAVPGALLFNGDVAGSFPYWFDPSRFEPAGAGHVSLAAQWRTLRSNVLWFALAGFNLLALGAMAFASARRRGPTRWNRCWAAFPSFALLELYALTNPTGRMGGAPPRALGNEPVSCVVSAPRMSTAMAASAVARIRTRHRAIRAITDTGRNAIRDQSRIAPRATAIKYSGSRKSHTRTNGARRVTTRMSAPSAMADQDSEGVGDAALRLIPFTASKTTSRAASAGAGSDHVVATSMTKRGTLRVRPNHELGPTNLLPASAATPAVLIIGR